jgi:hypothetical protein
MALPAASHSRDLTDERWVLIGPFLPKLARRTDGRGRPWRENRAVLNGICRSSGPAPHGPISRTGIPPNQTCHRRLRHRVRAGVLRAISRSSPRLSTTKAIWICRKPSSMGASHQRSREAPAWQDEARERLEDHGDRRPPRTPGCGSHRECHAARSHPVHAALAQRFVRVFGGSLSATSDTPTDF